VRPELLRVHFTHLHAHGYWPVSNGCPCDRRETISMTSVDRVLGLPLSLSVREGILIAVTAAWCRGVCFRYVTLPVDAFRRLLHVQEVCSRR
jgi:hypothetical protein